jgi:hypothetical protein
VLCYVSIEMIPLTYTFNNSSLVNKETEQYIKANLYLDTQLSELLWTYQCVWKIIPQTMESLWSGHFFPYKESWEELQISYNLCAQGLYKQSMVSLRSAFELGLLSVYWNLNDDGHKIIGDWVRSKSRTPFSNNIWNKIKHHHNFQSYQQSHDIKQRIDDLGHLHDYVHTNGYKFSNSTGRLKSNFQTFEESSFRMWFESFQEVVEILCILHLIKYPIAVIRYDYSLKFGIDIPSFGGVEESDIERLERIISPESFSTIEQIANNDPQVQALFNSIKEMPDMLGEQLEEQKLNQDKSLIQGMGFCE